MSEESLYRVVHQRQSRQLCAVHALNNLLQLHVDDTDGCSAAHQCMYQCGLFTVRRSCNLVTKVEMDQIADQLTLLENNLLQGKEVSAAVEGDRSGRVAAEGGGMSSPQSPQEPSLKEKLTSNHRTLYLGCYSFECLELCLQKRSVTLEWYRVPDDDPKDCSAALEKSVDPNQIVCGFIINLGDEGGLSNKSIWKSLRYVPFLSRFSHVGRHWFSVTRLRRRFDSFNGEAQSSSASTPSEAGEGWLVIDSDRQDIVELCSAELAEYLAEIEASGGQTFRATINLA
mmetsp:Transcript_20239/g.58058  ORF Transcript_20239/g.58058 Transcript_20239/m.58058 type:complete len:285 (-) Transcript_20239:182-1036(-)|eukprot:CAMPEP_0181049968 /NCGR_PEP_ID=MMETSP1070-20121207/16268_1 /TAXON_ID=265543 /ORGANISM="Minutocellus polymorphus, Strain NH13" /LENGTH=284 /DNA_ID=CAMNT_0023128887 /DNA_START=44 /DNA_END=898 /DNA_ORIENTATION=+